MVWHRNQWSAAWADGWQLCMGVYAFCLGLNWLLVPNFWETYPASFHLLTALGISQQSWGIGLIGAAASRFACLLLGPALRAIHGLLMGFMWIFLGSELLASRLMFGTHSPFGLFELMGGLGCFMAVLGLARQND